MSRRRGARRPLAKANSGPRAGVRRAEIAPAATYTPEDLQRLGQLASSLAPNRPLPRDPLWASVPFGPGQPLFPQGINPADPRTGRPQPRQFEYPVSWNLPGFNDRLIPWSILRAAADIPLFRQCMETRKNEIDTMQWDIQISPQAIERKQRRNPGTQRRSIVKQLMDELESEIDRLVAFWREPDRWSGYDFITWATVLLEEYFILDAIAIYPRRTLGGDVYGFEILDGTTIKPLLDDGGRRPLPPAPAYQQILWGFPRGEYVADIAVDPDTGAEIPVNGYQRDQLIYKAHHARTHTPYGHSAVERALEDGDLWMRRHGWLKSEYTDGVMPAGWLKAGEGQAEWSPQQLADYERQLNDYYAGQTANRQRFRILPYGMEPQKSADLGERYKPEYDLFLLKLVARHFDTTIAELGFTEPGGLGSAGWHEGQSDVQQRTGNRPTLARVQSLCTALQRKYLGAPEELVFRFMGLESEDEAADDAVWDTRVRSGRATRNEDRDRMGLPRSDTPEADMLSLSTDRGMVFLEGASQLAPAGTLVSPAPFMPQPLGFTGQPQPTTEGARGFHANAAPSVPAPVAGDNDPQAKVTTKADEIAAWRRWKAKNPEPKRPFEFRQVTMEDFAAAGVLWQPGTVLFKSDQSRPHHGDRTDHHKQPDYTAQDLGLKSLGQVDLDPQIPNIDRQHYQRDLDPDRVQKYLGEKTGKLEGRWGLVARRPDGSYWIINGQHHTLAAIQAGVSRLHYRAFDSTGPAMEKSVYDAWERWHEQYHN